MESPSVPSSSSNQLGFSEPDQKDEILNKFKYSMSNPKFREQQVLQLTDQLHKIYQSSPDSKKISFPDWLLSNKNLNEQFGKDVIDDVEYQHYKNVGKFPIEDAYDSNMNEVPQNDARKKLIEQLRSGFKKGPLGY